MQRILNMGPYLLRRLILCLISQMSGKDFAFDEDNFGWRIKNENRVLPWHERNGRIGR